MRPERACFHKRGNDRRVAPVPFLPSDVITNSPVKPGASAVNMPSASTVNGIWVSMPRARSAASFSIQISKSSGAVPGRGVHETGTRLFGDVIAVQQRDVEVVAV